MRPLKRAAEDHVMRVIGPQGFGIDGVKLPCLEDSVRVNGGALNAEARRFGTSFELGPGSRFSLTACCSKTRPCFPASRVVAVEA
jgi:hypothetical protein